LVCASATKASKHNRPLTKATIAIRMHFLHRAVGRRTSY
jgi:hypothetical protein